MKTMRQRKREIMSHVKMYTRKPLVIEVDACASCGEPIEHYEHHVNEGEVDTGLIREVYHYDTIANDLTLEEERGRDAYCILCTHKSPIGEPYDESGDYVSFKKEQPRDNTFALNNMRLGRA